MSRVRELGVWLHGEHVATLHAPRTGRVTCRYEDAVLDRLELNAPLLSCSLPLLGRAQDAWAFTDGLLPEGQHRQAMAALAGVSTIDLLGMLNRFGRDVAGAVIVSADDPPVRDPGVAPYTDDELAAEVAELDDHPLGLHDDSELSLAGLQDKMLLVRTPDGWARPLRGYPSTHILKVDDRRHRGIARAEHSCLQLARAAGLSAPSSELVTVGETECIVVERFDRQPAEDGTVTRLHQEDACQALGLDAGRNEHRGKYQRYGGPSLRDIADLLHRWGTATDLAGLVRQVVFTVVIGNADAHGKNIALVHPEPGRVELAPLYDTVPTALWPNLRQDLAMTVNGVSDLHRVTLNDVIAEAASWSGEVDAGTEVTATAAALHHALEHEDVGMDPVVARAVESRLRALAS